MLMDFQWSLPGEAHCRRQSLTTTLSLVTHLLTLGGKETTKSSINIKSLPASERERDSKRMERDEIELW